MDEFNINIRIKELPGSHSTVADSSEAREIIEECSRMLQSGDLKGVERANVLCRIAEAFFKIENSQSALKYWHEAATEFHHLNETVRKARTLIKIGTLYQHTMDFVNAESKYNEAKAIFEKNGDPNGIALCSYKIGDMFLDSGDIHKALEQLLNADSMKEDSDDKDYCILKGDINNKLGEINSKLMNLDDALKYFFEAMQVFNYIDYPEGIIQVMNNIGMIFMREGLFEEAETFFRDGYEHAKNGKSKITELKYLGNLAELQARKGDFSEAYSLLIEAYNLRDQIFSQTLSQKITDIETRHEIERKEKELEIYRLKNIDLENANTTIQLKNEELTSAYKKMELLAQTDPLTGLANRRQCLDRINEEKLRFERNKQPFSFILIDIDYFKKFNDTWGHDFGDMVLVEIAGLLRESTRQLDTSSRWGGEEFLILLPNTTLEGALTLAEKIRTRVEKHKKVIGGKQACVTVSIGVSQFDENCSTIDDCIKKADTALYNGKENGRNRVEHL